MSNKIGLRLLVMGLCVFGHGCTYQAWYGGLQERQRQECYRLANSGDVQSCLDNVNRTTYDAYKTQRDEAANPSK